MRSLPTLLPDLATEPRAPHASAQEAADLVAGGVAHDTADHGHHDHEEQVELALVGEEASEQQRGLARHEQAHERGRFEGGQREEQHVAPRVHGLAQELRNTCGHGDGLVAPESEVRAPTSAGSPPPS